ncbi:MAG: T9SS type A sorting domain-containing protein [Saprospiraceae bacterium]|nr:T9SS type A sorting domain-containing protein [Saprospiraceae bacterium]
MTQRIFLFCLLFTSGPFALFSQWEDVSLNENLEVIDVHFWNNTTGIVCGVNKIYKTANAGMSWTTTFDAGTDDIFFEDVETIGNNIAIAVGKNITTNKSVILRSTTMGSSWVNIPVNDNVFFTDIYFLNNNIGYCTGGSNALYKTVNGGQSWQWITGQGGFGTESVFFTDEQTGYLCGGGPDNASMVKTTDGGQNWFPLDVMGVNFLRSIYFTDNLTGFVVGWGGGIYKTTDAGVSWTEQLVATMQGNLKVTFTDTETGYIAGGISNTGSILKTENAGVTWFETAPAGTKAMISIDFPSDQVGYACGSSGTVLRTNNGGTTSIGNLPTGKNNFNVYPNPVENLLTVDGGEQPITKLNLYDSNGSMIRSISCSNPLETMDMASLPAGNYYVTVYGKTGTSAYKVVKIR